MKRGRLTCRALVDAYLRRIDAYDKNGPALNAIVVVNPDADREAPTRSIGAMRSADVVGPLHCVPAIVKDNFETIGLQSAAGSLSLKGFVSNKDAFLVKRIKDAGAIVLAKSNMAEFAFSPVRDGELAAARLHAQPLRARSRDRRVERRDRRRGRRQLRRWSASAAIPATRSAVRRRTRRSSASDRRWG